MAERDPRTYAIIGAAMEVHRTLGCGFLEKVYQKAFAVELEQRGIPFVSEEHLPVHYKGEKLDCHYEADFICFGDVIVETKALHEIGGVEKAQLLNYLKVAGMKVGLIINFGAESLQFERMVL